jgi:hypothetical protein
LPHPLHPDHHLVVTRVRGGGPPEVLVEGVDYVVEPSGGEDCEVDGEPRPAIAFPKDAPRTTNDSITVEYQADPMF